MKTLILYTTALLCVFAPLRETQAASPLSEYQAGEVQVEALAFSETADLKEFDGGGGVAMTYWHWENAGVGFEGKTFDTAHALFDTIGLNLAARYPTKIVTPFTKIGFDWHAEQVRNPRANDFDVYVGIGLEKRFSLGSVKNLGAAVEVRGVRAAELSPDERLQVLARIGKTF